jgi:hypothetical protein
MLDYIDGYKFSEIAKFKVDRDHKYMTTEIFRSNSILYCKTDFLPDMFDFIKLSGRKYILISHMSDIPIDEKKYQSKPNCIKIWYAQNAIYDNDNLISIPIGLGNHEGGSKSSTTDHKWLSENIERLKLIPKSGVYCNWAITNSSRSDILKKIKVPYHWEYGISFKEYCENMSHYQFVICPFGNGVDTHRFWEALYMGCIPITLKHHIYRDFNLPAIQVLTWEEVIPELLLQPIQGNTEQLYMSYWINKISEKFKNL